MHPYSNPLKSGIRGQASRSGGLSFNETFINHGVGLPGVRYVSFRAKMHILTLCSILQNDEVSGKGENTTHFLKLKSQVDIDNF